MCTTIPMPKQNLKNMSMKSQLKGKLNYSFIEVVDKIFGSCI